MPLKAHQLLPALPRAVRGLWGARGFTALCVLTLAVGIGAVTAVFGIVDAVLLQRSPIPRPSAWSP
jgi:hypothetical protein